MTATPAKHPAQAQTQTQPKNWKPWLVFLGCCILSFIGFAFIVNTMGLYFAPLGEELGATRAQVASAASVLTLASIPTILVAGSIMKRIDSRILISVCIAACSALFFAQSLFTELWQFYVSFALMGVAFVIPIALAPSVLLANWFEKKLGLAMGIALGISGLGGMVFNPVVSSWITTFGWRMSYRITALIILACILPFSLFVFKYRPLAEKGEYAYGHEVGASETVKKDTVEPTEPEGLTLRQAARTKSFALLILVSVLLQSVAALVQHVSGMELAQGLTLEQGSLVVSGIMFGAAVGKATIGILLDKMKTQVVIALYAAVGLAGWALMALTTVPALAACAGFLAGVGQGVVLISLPWMIRLFFGVKDYAMILSVVSVAGSVASAVANTLHGMVFDAFGSYLPSLGANVAFYVLAAACAIAAYMLRPAASKEA
ncbi:MFS transporter [Alloscardovia macacae]|uniref:Permease n=1 Tax=Alloscardovia macacae TaxID=1160091 RepID=A0A261F5K3_9BIFI|nr:MFS transporter [Alloscardovia macacae]OZG54384.1 permease [Alloscardovia macacae]